MSKLLTTEQVNTLNEAREILQAIANSNAWADAEASMAHRLGMLGEAADIAENTVFNVLNTAANMCDSVEAKAGIDAFNADREARRARRRAA